MFTVSAYSIYVLYLFDISKNMIPLRNETILHLEEKYLYPQIGRNNSWSDKFMKSLTGVTEFAVRFMRAMHVRHCNEESELKFNFYDSDMKALEYLDLR